MKQTVIMLAGFMTAHMALADMEPMTALSGNSVPLTLTLVVEQETCDMTLITPETIKFIPITQRDLDRGPGTIERLAPQIISLNLTKCQGSARDGAVPAIQVLGNNPIGDAPRIFRDDGSTAEGKIGFGLRYQEQNTGIPGSYLTNMDFADLATVGLAAKDGIQNFLVDIQYGGGPVTSGAILASVRFRFMYH